jgi:hypothetical protein
MLKARRRHVEEEERRERVLPLQLLVPTVLRSLWSSPSRRQCRAELALQELAARILGQARDEDHALGHRH